MDVKEYNIGRAKDCGSAEKNKLLTFYSSGSGAHWADAYRSVEMNAIFMTGEEFRNFYGLNDKSYCEIADFVKNNGLADLTLRFSFKNLTPTRRMLLRVALIISFLVVSHLGRAQESLRLRIFGQVLLSENLWDKVFLNQGSSVDNAYLMIDSTFVHTCPSILNSLQKYRGRVPLTTDGNRSVFIVNDPWFNIERVPLFVLFKSIHVNGKKMQLVFRTSSLYLRKEYRDRYCEITCHLDLRGEKWMLQKCKIRSLACCDNVFGEIEIH